MERYLIQNSRFFVLAGSCKGSDSETDGGEEAWQPGNDWDDQTSAHFEQLLAGTLLEVKGDKDSDDDAK